MNEGLRAIFQNNAFAISMAVITLVITGVNAYTFQQLTPLRDDIASLRFTVKAIEDNVDAQPIILQRLSAIDQHLVSIDKQLERIDNRIQ